MPNSNNNLKEHEIQDFERLVKKLGCDDAISIIIPVCYSVLTERQAFPTRTDVKQLRYKPATYGNQISPYEYKFLKDFINKCSNADIKTLVSYLVSDNNYRQSKLDSFASMCSTEDIGKLVYGLLKFENGDSFYDLGSGLGTLLTNVYLDASNDGIFLSRLDGCEINSSLAELSEMIIEILTNGKANYSIQNENAIYGTYDNRGNTNKGYVYPPIGIMFAVRGKYYHSDLFGDFEANSSIGDTWFFIDKLLCSLNKENSRAVALVSARSLRNMTKNKYAQCLIERGLLEGIIELPGGHLPYTMIPVYLLVFSQDNNKLKFIDASDCARGEEKRFHRTFIKLDIDKVLNLYESGDGNHCNLIDYDQLRTISNWIPSSIPSTINNYKNDDYIPLASVSTTSIGCSYTASSFDKSDSPTGYKVLSSGDIENGTINWDGLVSIKQPKSLFDRFAIHKDDVIINTKSTKIKVAVVDKEPEEEVILTGGMIKITPDTTKLNPTYLKMYFDSEEGIELLKSCSSATYLIHLTSDVFKDIKIPLIDIDKQNKKAEQYNDGLSKIKTYRERIKEIETSMNQLIDEED